MNEKTNEVLLRALQEIAKNSNCAMSRGFALAALEQAKRG